MPARLRPTAPLAADAILVGDPGRAMLLAQELLEQPKMSNHARGLWGYTGRTPDGRELTIQSTGMGGPSAAAVLSDLAELGIRRAVRIGTCVGLVKETRPAELLLVAEALATGGSATSFGVEVGTAVSPDPFLLDGLGHALETEARHARVASLDTAPAQAGAVGDVVAADLQTVAVLALGRELGIAAAAVLVVAETPRGEPVGEERLEAAVRRAGRAASSVFST
jgi:purine-nucleoside phosphorylase